MWKTAKKPINQASYRSRGKSSLLVPLFGDQVRNAAAAEFVGFGHLFDKADMEDADKIETALTEILEDEGYGIIDWLSTNFNYSEKVQWQWWIGIRYWARKVGKDLSIDFRRLARAREVKRVMDSRPFTPRELLVRHVEFAAKFGQQKTLDSQVGWNWGEKCEVHRSKFTFSLSLHLDPLISSHFQLSHLAPLFPKINRNHKIFLGSWSLLRRLLQHRHYRHNYSIPYSVPLHFLSFIVNCALLCKRSER